MTNFHKFFEVTFVTWSAVWRKSFCCITFKHINLSMWRAKAVTAMDIWLNVFYRKAFILKFSIYLNCDFLVSSFSTKVFFSFCCSSSNSNHTKVNTFIINFYSTGSITWSCYHQFLSAKVVMNYVLRKWFLLKRWH